MRMKGLRASRRRGLGSQCPQRALRILDSRELVSQESRLFFLVSLWFFRAHPWNCSEKADLSLITIQPKAAYRRPQNKSPNSAVLLRELRTGLPNQNPVLSFYKLTFYLQRWCCGKGSYYFVPLIMSPLSKALSFLPQTLLDETDSPTNITTKKVMQRLRGFEFLEYIIPSHDRTTVHGPCSIGECQTLQTAQHAPE